VESRVRVLQEGQAAKIAAGDGAVSGARDSAGDGAGDGAGQRVRSGETDVAAQHGPAAGPRSLWPPKNGQGSAQQNGPLAASVAGSGPDEPLAAPGVTPIGALTKPGRVTVEGRIRVVEIRPVERNTVLACEISDGTGQLTALFYGRSHIPGIVCGARVRFRGSVGLKADGHPVMTNPAYELLFPAV
jgi:hypothetical protein